MNAEEATFVSIVSGLPRSGTSVMMQMLQAGGMPIITDRLRVADQDNLEGYYELEAVKRTSRDPSWVKDAPGNAVKVIYMLLNQLPREYTYRVVFMRRELKEVVRSQEAMLQRRQEQGAEVPATALEGIFQRHLEKVDAWLARQPNFQVCDVDYGHVISDPQVQARRVREFLHANLDVDAMAATVDPALHRQRTG